MKWNPIDTLPDGKIVLLYQRADEEKFRSAGMIVGSIERSTRIGVAAGFYVHPDMIGGYEMECEIIHPTHWAELPDPPA